VPGSNDRERKKSLQGFGRQKEETGNREKQGKKKSDGEIVYDFKGGGGGKKEVHRVRRTDARN